MSRSKKKSGANKFFVSELCYPQTIDILKTRSEPLGIELVIDDYNSIELSEEFFGIILQYPAKYGEVIDYSEIVTKAKENEKKLSLYGENGYNAFINQNYWETQEERLFDIYKVLIKK